LEEPARVRRRRAGALVAGAALVAVSVAGSPGSARALGEDPAAEITEALRSLGPPGVLWGRLAIEEESPLGPWTPLNGIEVTLYPATPSLVAEIERIRQSARGSGAQYESAVTRVQAALAAHQSRIDHQTPSPAREELVAEPPFIVKPRPKPAAAPGGTDRSGAAPASRGAAPASSAAEEPRNAWRQKTDPAGLFAFDPLPAGDWLVVVIRVSPYAGSEKTRPAPRPRQQSKAQAFLPRTAGPAKEAEVWVSRVRVVTGERVGLELTDRARWMVGPVR
jgi:hypothetical protein